MIKEEPIYECKVYEKCTLLPISAEVATCDNCGYKLRENEQDFSSRWLDPLIVYDRTRQRTHALRNMLAGGRAFLVCGGPSATVEILEKLSQRGMFSLAVNNKAGHSIYRPQAFVYSDTSSKFSHSIWNDPAIMKFCPRPKFTGNRSELLRKDPTSKKFLPDGTVMDKPNIWGFCRRGWGEPNDTFFTEESASWGNLKEGVERTGRPKGVSTMLLGIRILYYLGARNIFLVGADFNMQPGREYSFNQGKESNGACDSNNDLYRTINNFLVETVESGAFDKFGLKIYNCNKNSGLTAFKHIPIDRCIDLATGGGRQVERDPDLSHWYEKIEEHKMDIIQKMILEGCELTDIVDKLNEGVKKERKKISVEKVATYIRVLKERYS